MESTINKRPTRKTLLHRNYINAQHKPDWLKKYENTSEKDCKFCGAKPSNIVIYDMPLKGGKVVKVKRCTVCDNLLIVSKVRDRAEES